jgi:hypothetical protein
VEVPKLEAPVIASARRRASDLPTRQKGGSTGPLAPRSSSPIRQLDVNTKTDATLNAGAGEKTASIARPTAKGAAGGALRCPR